MNLPARHQGFVARVVVAGLCYAQPLVRSWHRYRTRFVSAGDPGRICELDGRLNAGMPLTGRRTLTFWSSQGSDRTDLLARAIEFLSQRRWGHLIDSGWSNWDLEIDCHPGTVVQVQTAQENHGGGQRLIRVQFRLRPRVFVASVCLALATVSLAISPFSTWVAPAAAVLSTFLAINWWRATRAGGHIVGLFERVAEEMDLISCPMERRVTPPSGQEFPQSG